MKKQNGITLVALVITIIVLLILAGVSISLALGNNGVLTRASSAVTANEVGTIKQELGLAIQDAEGKYYEEWVKNASYKKIDAFKVESGVYSANCTSAKEVTGVYPSSDKTKITGYYKSTSDTVYYFEVDVSAGKLLHLRRIDSSTATKATTTPTVGEGETPAYYEGQYIKNNAPVTTGDEL